MRTKTYRLRHPVAVMIRDGKTTKEARIEEVVFHRRDDGDVEPNLALVTNCARGMEDLDGAPATVEDLLHFHVEQGMAAAAAAAFNTAQVL